MHVGEELADVLLYLVRLAGWGGCCAIVLSRVSQLGVALPLPLFPCVADRCGIDLAEVTLNKIDKNAAKYPAER